jgi:hypothetical protein
VRRPEEPWSHAQLQPWSAASPREPWWPLRICLPPPAADLSALVPAQQGTTHETIEVIKPHDIQVTQARTKGT